MPVAIASKPKTAASKTVLEPAAKPLAKPKSTRASATLTLSSKNYSSWSLRG